MNKKGFIDGETLTKPGFWALTVGGWASTIIGWKMSLKMDSGGFPLWQLIVILLVIAVAAAFFARD